jgi:hypothetical protein
MTLVRSAIKIVSLSIYVQEEDVLLYSLATYTNIFSFQKNILIYLGA